MGPPSPRSGEGARVRTDVGRAGISTDRHGGLSYRASTGQAIRPEKTSNKCCRLSTLVSCLSTAVSRVRTEVGRAGISTDRHGSLSYRASAWRPRTATPPDDNHQRLTTPLTGTPQENPTR